MRDTPHRLMAIAESRAEMADARVGELESERDSLRSQVEALREACNFAIKVLRLDFPGSIKRKAAIEELERALESKQ